MIDILIHAAVICVIGGLIYMFVGMLPIAEPFKKMALMCILAVVILLLVFLLLGLAPLSYHWG